MHTSGDTFTERNLCPAFRQLRGGQRTLPGSADSPLPSTQSNPYTKTQVVIKEVEKNLELGTHNNR